MFDFVPGWLLKPVLGLASQWGWLDGKINALIINAAVNVCRHRPHPWSTVHDYVSWTSLSDQRFSARHLPAFHPTTPPPIATSLIDLFRRPTGGQRLSPKSTCLFPAFAQYLTDGFIRTRMPHDDEPKELRRQNTSNHQIDMCPLYGRTIGQTLALRLNSQAGGERGRLKSQMIKGEEYSPFLFDSAGDIKGEFKDVLDPPLGLSTVTNPQRRAVIFATGGDRVNSSPQIAMMNTLFLREHNRLAKTIEQQNPGWDDERVFQTARNIIIAMFIKIVVEEYINHIIPLPFRLSADPSVAWNAPWNKPNWITTEFSLLYRWHSLIPDTMVWGAGQYAAKDTILNNSLLLDNGLTQSFVDMSAQATGQLGAFNTADALLDIEQLAINQGRLCDVAPYAAYRKYVGLSVPTSFEEISKDARVVAFLKNAYKSPADIDFYIGLFSEDVVDNSPLPPLILRMVAVDAFSQALTNPLLSEHVFNEGTFTPIGWKTIQDTGSLRDIVARNSKQDIGIARISMTRPDWKYH
jgi:prostaglandin-endoperoxide synthase 2